ncbi:MAG: DUF4269 domain-containing protein [Cyanobacteria bacterium P01_A01_bin.17]
MLKLKKTPLLQPDWRDLTYLLDGTATQQAAYSALDSFQMASLLQRFDPILVGTIPLDVDIPGSDLDIVCCTANVDDFAQFLFETGHPPRRSHRHQRGPAPLVQDAPRRGHRRRH